MPNQNPKKGKKIWFVAGLYKGKKGWLDTSKQCESGSPNVFVIVDMGKGIEKATYAQFTSFRDPHEKPANFEQAALQQHPDIEQTLVKLATMFAQCRISITVNAVTLLEEEIHKQQKFMRTLGRRARYRFVDFDEEEAEAGRKRKAAAKKAQDDIDQMSDDMNFG